MVRTRFGSIRRKDQARECGNFSDQHQLRHPTHGELMVGDDQKYSIFQ